MGLDSSNGGDGGLCRTNMKLAAVAALLACWVGMAAAQDVMLKVTYVCGGEHIYIDGCNIRDLSDTAMCSVVHPDHVGASGIAALSSATRGALKKLLPTCTQPSPREIAAEAAFEKKQQELYDANVARANPQPAAARPAQSASGAGQQQSYAQQAAQVAPPKDAEERAMRRCVSSGRLPATCTGNQLLGAFGQMLGQVLPSAAKQPPPGPEMAGAYEGAGGWRLNFIDGGVLVNCAFLSPNQEAYTIDFRNNRAVITVDTRPKPLVLGFRADAGATGGGAITGPGPVTIDGVVASGTSHSGPDPNASSGYTDQYGMSLSNSQAAAGGEVYRGGQRVYGSTNTGGSTYTNFAPRRATCPALNLTSKGAGTGVQTMQTDLLKSVFSDGDKGPPTPAGIRMHGIYASAATGFSVQFFPESAVLGCGPDAARAYPYSVVADGASAAVKVEAPDHPLTLAFRGDGSLDPGGAGAYQVHGRVTVGQNDDGDFTFVPMEETCSLAVLTPSTEIPASGGMAAAAGGGGSAGARRTPGSGLSVPQAPLGNATLTVVSGLAAQAGTPNALAGRPYVLLRESYADTLADGGVAVPAGMSPYLFVASACGPNRTPDCQKVNAAIMASAASAVRADGSGSGTFPGVPPGRYYLMISARYNNQGLAWGQAVELNAGSNSLRLDARSATPIQ